MNCENYYRNAGYNQGLVDGKRTRGKINRKYIECLFRSETQNLSNNDSKEYKKGWQDGFADAVRGTISDQILKEDCVINHLDEVYGIG